MLKRIVAVVALVLAALAVGVAPAQAECPGEKTLPSGSWSIVHSTKIC